MSPATALAAEEPDDQHIDVDKLRAGAIRADRIAVGSITADKLTANSVTSHELVAGAVTADKISARSVTAEIVGPSVALSREGASTGVDEGWDFDGDLRSTEKEAPAPVRRPRMEALPYLAMAVAFIGACVVGGADGPVSVAVGSVILAGALVMSFTALWWAARRGGGRR